ncbi:hypothetical protein EPUL_002635, partial [Erysiphe pulchra]
MTNSMDISQETQAPSTDRSHQPPPIPPIPNFPSPSAPLTLLSNSAMSNTILDGRQILKPVAPSKRSVTERPTSDSDKSDSRNAFFPKELADTIAIRQRRERAWHARLLICTTIISSIDSSNFHDEVEKEEVVAFKAYLRQAIANFAATDSSPSPPRVPVHTRPNKGGGNNNGKGKDKDKISTKKVAVATPKIILSQGSNLGSLNEVELPRIISSSDKSVARKGQFTRCLRNQSCTKTITEGQSLGGPIVQKTHPFYDLHLPFGGDNVRPRAATYIRKDPKRLTSKQRHPQSPTGYYCWVEVN